MVPSLELANGSNFIPAHPGSETELFMKQTIMWTWRFSILST